MTETTTAALEPDHHSQAPGQAHTHTGAHHPGASARSHARTVLAWPAWWRVAAVLPVVLALWLAVWWANEGVALW